MKKAVLYLCGWIFAVLCIVSCGSDDDDSSKKPTVVEVTSVQLSQTKMTLQAGDTLTLTVIVSPANATDKTVTWKSSDTSVATVSSSGVVKAIKEGEATITATAGGKSATCQVTVKPNVVAVTSVTLSASELSLKVGDSQTLTATVSPSNATDKNVTWKSSNTSVATVSSSGVVKATGVGNAVITATAGGKSATCQVKVKQEDGGVDASIDPWDESEEYHGTVN